MRNIKQWLMGLRRTPTSRAVKNECVSFTPKKALRTPDSQVTHKKGEYIMFKITRVLQYFMCASLALVLMGSAQAGNDDDKFKVGYMTLKNVGLTTGNTTVTIWYPAAQGHPGGSAGPYDIDIQGSVAAGPTVVTVHPPSPIGALRNARLANGNFPLVVVAPSGGLMDGHFYGGAESNEIFASRGYIVVGYGATADLCGAGQFDVSALIDYMVNVSPVKGSIKKDSVALVSISSASTATLATAGGSSNGLVADKRVKALILKEPSTSCNASNQPNIAAVKVPTLIFDGSPFLPFGDQTALFNNLVSSQPRYKATLGKVAHFAYIDGLCITLEGARQASLQYQLDHGTLHQNLLEPVNLSYHSIAVSTNDAAGEYLSFYWNFGNIIHYPPIGNGGDFCSRVGVNDPSLDTDLNHDGFTDIPPLLSASAVVLSNEETVKSTTRLEDAFLDLHLKNIGSAAKILTEEKAEQDPNVKVFMSEGTKKQCGF